MRRTVLTVLCACAVSAISNTTTVSAQTPDILETNTLPTVTLESAELPINDLLAPVVPTAADNQQQEQTYVLKQNESLSTVAEQFSTDWYRLYNKNPQISTPDFVSLNQNL
jgi:uncharacterized protein YqkB